MSTETATPVEAAPAAAAVVEQTPAAPSSMAAAFTQASEKASKAKAAPAPAAVAEPAKAAPVAPAKPAAVPAAKPDALEAAAAALADPNHVALPFDSIEDETPAAEEGTSDERASRRIEALRGEIKSTWKPKIAELEETIKQRDSRLAELEAFAKERDELLESKKQWEAEMTVTKLERTPAYIKAVTEPETRIVSEAQAIIEQYGLNPDAIFAAMVEPDKMKRSAAFKAATSGLDVDPDHAYELRKLADEARVVMSKKDELYKNADAALAETAAHTEKELAAQAIARAEERGKATDLVVDRISRKLPFVAEMVKAVAGTVKETNFLELDPQKQAYSVMMGEAFPKLAVEHIQLQAKYDAALDELASYTKASPRVDGGLSRTTGAGDPPKSMAEAAARAAGSR